MKKVSVCLILGSDYWGTIYSLERSGFNIIEKKSEFIVKGTPKEYIKVIDNTEVELLVAYKNTSDERLVEYFKPIATELIDVTSYKNSSDTTTDAQAYNALFRKAQHEYICIFKPYVFLQQHWLIELIHYHQSVNKSGVIGICPNFNNVEFLPLPSPDIETFVNVFLPKDKLVNINGVCFFAKEYLYFIGALDESELFVGGSELIQFQLRCVAMGYTNYYIPTQTCLITREHALTDYISHETSKQNITKTLAEMKKNKNYYIPLDAIPH